MFLRTIAIAGWLALSLPGILSASEVTEKALDEALTLPALWETSGEQFVESHGELGFRWISATQDVAQNTRKEATLFGIPVCQTLVRMKEGKVDHYSALFYNRGDMGELRKDDYEALLKRVITTLSEATGTKQQERGRDQSSAVRAYGLIWDTAAATYLLEYSFTRGNPAIGEPYRAEFIRLEVSPKEAPKSLIAEAFSANRQEKYNGPAQVVREADSGNVFIKEVPMVDQGQKGYCVVASVERVLRLYGVRVDSNELAQLADSSASEGTSVDAMTDSLKKLTARFKIKVRTPVDFNIRDFTRFLEEYNRAAKRAKEPPVVLAASNTLSGLYGRMNPDILREVKGKNRSQYTAFQRQVRTHIDKGVPMLWSVMLGVIPEPNLTLQSAGGHMRLIIGYNDKTEEIIYSDSWGIGHEFSKMPMLDAWSITTNLASVEPL